MPRTRGLGPRLVDRQFRVVLPRAVAKVLDVQAWDHVAFILEDGEVRLRKAEWSLR